MPSDKQRLDWMLKRRAKVHESMVYGEWVAWPRDDKGFMGNRIIAVGGPRQAIDAAMRAEAKV